MPSPENSANISRNESNQIVDREDRPLEMVAQYGVASARVAHERVEELEDAVQAARRIGGNATQEYYDAVHSANLAVRDEKAALWDGYQHYNQNRAGYQQAAIDEDAKRPEMERIREAQREHIENLKKPFISQSDEVWKEEEQERRLTKDELTECIDDIFTFVDDLREGSPHIVLRDDGGVVTAITLRQNTDSGVRDRYTLTRPTDKEYEYDVKAYRDASTDNYRWSKGGDEIVSGADMYTDWKADVSDPRRGPRLLTADEISNLLEDIGWLEEQ